MYVDLYLGDKLQGVCKLMDAEKWRRSNPYIRLKFQTQEDIVMWFNLIPSFEQQFIMDETVELDHNYGAISMKMIQFGIIKEDGTLTEMGKALRSEVNG